MLTHDSRGRAARLLHELGLAGAVFGEERDYDPAPVDGLGPDASYAAALAALLIGRGAWVIDRPDPEVVPKVRRALLLSNDERDGLRNSLHALAALRRSWDGLGEAGRKRLASDPGFADAMAVLTVLDRPRAAAARAEVDRLRARHGGLRPEPYLDGDQLIAMGLTPGPRFASILEQVYDAQLEGRVASAGEARELAERLGAG